MPLTRNQKILIGSGTGILLLAAFIGLLYYLGKQRFARLQALYYQHHLSSLSSSTKGNL